MFRTAACVLLMSVQASAQEYHVKDLTTAGYGWARLTGVASGKQVGIAGLADRNREHSMLLSGTALSAQDLTPFDAVQQAGRLLRGRRESWRVSAAIVMEGTISTCAGCDRDRAGRGQHNKKAIYV